MRQLLILILSITTLALSAQPKRIWIDTDIMIGKFRRDVDDGLALLAALSSDSVEVVGISLTVGVDYGEKVTHKLLNWYAPDKQIPVYIGAKSAEEAGVSTPASDALIAALSKEPLTVVSLGPATNIATALKQEPSIAKNISELVFCKGREPGDTFNPGKGKVKFNDYNFELDPQAVEDILQTDIKVVLAGYPVTKTIFLDRADIKLFKNKLNPGNKWIYRQLKSWQNLWKLFIGTGKDGFIPFDAVTLGYVLRPDLYETVELPVEIQVLESDTKKRNKEPMKPYLLVSEKFESTRKVIYCKRVDDAYKDYLLQLLKDISR